MRTLEAISISRTILDNLEVNKSELIEDMSKNGFVSVDGTIKQYVPGMYTFIPINDSELKRYINQSIKNRWSSISDNRIIINLKEELPQLTESEILHFNAYIKQYQVEINEDEINQELTEAINKNNQLQNFDIDFKGNKDILNQLIILRNNNIFTADINRLFKFKNGKFERFTSNDVMGLLNDKIATDEIYFRPQEIKNNWNIYVDSLTDVTKVKKQLRQKEKKETTLKEYESEYKEVLKVIKTY